MNPDPCNPLVENKSNIVTDSLLHEIASLQNENSELRKKVRTYQSDIKEWEALVGITGEEIHRLDLESDNLRMFKEAWEKDALDKVQKIAELKRQLESKNTEMDAVQEERPMDLSQRLSELENVVNYFRTRFIAHEGSNESMIKDICRRLNERDK
jgi:chromosome segregation ATPase